MDDIISVRAEAADRGSRLDKFLSEALPEVSRSRIQKLLEEGRILKDGSVPKGSEKLRGTEHFLITLPPPEPLKIEAENIPLDIVYEDKDLIVVDKPRGMVVHPAPGNYSGTLVNALMWHFEGELSGINGVLRPGIVHRIDKDTAGLLVVCKTDRAHQGMAQMLKTHDIERVYHAIVFGNIKEDTGTVDAPIGRDEQDRKKMGIRKDGRRAVTHYKVLERFGEFTYIEAQLETGRTHQIRVHMRSIGHPLLGDTVYGSSRNPYHLEGQALHAMILGFVHPRTGEYMEFTAPLPEYFVKLLTKLRK